jgi:hypothetical protein
MQQGGSTSSQGSQSVISAAELKDAPYSNLLDLIQALRPRWLQGSFLSGGGRATPEVFMDNQELGGLDALRDVPLTAAAEVRYYEPSEAAATFGPEHANGVIRVRSRGSR